MTKKRELRRQLEKARQELKDLRQWVQTLHESAAVDSELAKVDLRKRVADAERESNEMRRTGPQIAETPLVEALREMFDVTVESGAKGLLRTPDGPIHVSDLAGYLLERVRRLKLGPVVTVGGNAPARKLPDDDSTELEPWVY